MKRGFIIILLILVVGGLLMLIVLNLSTFWQQRSAQKKQLTVIPSPTLEYFPYTSDQPTYQTQRIATLQLPATVPIYKNNEVADLQTQAARIATTFGFTSIGDKEETTRGVFYAWKDEAQDLRIGGNPLEVSLMVTTNAGLNTQKLPQPDTYYDQLSRDFITKHALITPYTKLSQPYFDYLRANTAHMGLVSRSEANVITVKYYFELEGIPVYFEPTGFALLFQFDSTNGLVSFSSHLLPGINQTQTITRIASIETIKQRLINNQGVIFSVGPQAVSESNQFPLSYKVTEITAENAQLFYYFSPSQEILSPVLLISGSSYDEQNKAMMNTLTAVPASE